MQLESLQIEPEVWELACSLLKQVSNAINFNLKLNSCKLIMKSIAVNIPNLRIALRSAKNSSLRLQQSKNASSNLIMTCWSQGKYLPQRMLLDSINGQITMHRCAFIPA